MTGFRLYAMIGLIIAGVSGVVAYTAWQRHDAVAASNFKAVVKKDIQVDKVEKKNDEIRNAVHDDADLVKRLRAGVW